MATHRTFWVFPLSFNLWSPSSSSSKGHEELSSKCRHTDKSKEEPHRTQENSASSRGGGGSRGLVCVGHFCQEMGPYILWMNFSASERLSHRAHSKRGQGRQDGIFLNRTEEPSSDPQNPHKSVRRELAHPADVSWHTHTPAPTCVLTHACTYAHVCVLTHAHTYTHVYIMQYWIIKKQLKRVLERWLRG